MSGLNRVLASLGLVVVFGCEISFGNPTHPAPNAQTAKAAPAIQAPQQGLANEQECRPPCWIFDGECNCVAAERFKAFLPYTARNTDLTCDGQFIDGACVRRLNTCPGRVVDGICIIGP